jgi:hypothetical protein
MAQMPESENALAPARVTDDERRDESVNFSRGTTLLGEWLAQLITHHMMGAPCNAGLFAAANVRGADY